MKGHAPSWTGDKPQCREHGHAWRKPLGGGDWPHLRICNRCLRYGWQK